MKSLEGGTDAIAQEFFFFETNKETTTLYLPLELSGSQCQRLLPPIFSLASARLVLTSQVEITRQWEK